MGTVMSWSIAQVARMSGVTARTLRQYDDEARERWPEDFERAQRKRQQMTEGDIEHWQRETTAAMIRMAEFMAAGTPVDDPAVLDEVHRHWQSMCEWWTPSRTAYTCLGRMYVDDERFKANYLKIAEGLAEYQAAAMAAYADARLSD